MYEVMQSLTEQQKLQIADELEKLFTLQDRPFTKAKSATFIEEFEKTGLPAGAIISGVRGLFYEDVGQIKFPILVAAARSKIEHEDFQATDCDHCFKSGMVLMKDEAGYEFSFACICLNANKAAHHNLKRWNGEEIQLHRGKSFKKRFT